MKIYNSTEYFDREKETELYYELSVVNQWNWSAKTICWNKLSDGTIIRYELRQGNPHKIMSLEDITEEMRRKLTEMGYKVK